VSHKTLVAPIPPMHLAALELRDGKPRALRDHSQSVLYHQRGNDVVELYVVSELYDTQPSHLIDVNLQSWTFGMRKARILEGSHYLFCSKDHGVVAIMAAKNDTERTERQIFIPIRLKPRPKRGGDLFRDLLELGGSEFFERLCGVQRS
jgi:hypothetical protein